MNHPRTSESTHPGTPSWDRLVSTALVGTSRRPVPDLPDLPRGPREGAAGLLDLAAVDTVRTRAGYTAHTADPVTPDAPDTRPRVGAAATHRLDVILADRPELLSEWLEHAVRGGRRVSHTQIPDLLERASRDSGLRPLVATAVGARGTWLASFNNAWSFIAREPLATDAYTDADWHDGTAAQRRRALFALRATDPAAARGLLAAAWPEESKGEERRGLLEALEVNLGPDDEAVLDTALDDRSANVRGLALALLTRLPDSAHAHRLRAHLRDLVRSDQGAPHEVDIVDMDIRSTDLLRDLALVVPKSRQQSAGQRWERGRVLVNHVPLDTWTELLGTGPAGVLGLAEQERDLREGLTDAVCLQADPDWARAVLDHPGTGMAQLLSPGVRNRHWPRTRELLAALPAQERCARVLAAITSGGKGAEQGRGQGEAPVAVAAGRTAPLAGETGVLGQVLHAIDAPWTPELSAEVARRLAGQLGPRDSRGYRFLCESAAEHMPPEHLALLPEQPPHTEEAPAYLRLRETLRFRLDMHREL